MNLLHKFDLATNTEPNLWKPLSCQNFGNSANDNRYVRSSSKVELFMYRTPIPVWVDPKMQFQRSPDSDVELAELNYLDSIHFYDVQWSTMLISKDKLR